MTRITALGALVFLWTAATGCQAGVVAGGLVAHTELDQEAQATQAVYKTFLRNDAALEKAEVDLTVRTSCGAPASSGAVIATPAIVTTGAPAGLCGLVDDEPSWKHCAARMKECTTEACSSGYVKAFNMVLKSRYFAADGAEVEASCKVEGRACASGHDVELKFVDSHNRHLKLLVDAKKAENKAKFDAHDATTMNAYSDDLAREIEKWRAATAARAVCQ